MMGLSMEERVKFAVLLIAVILVSVSTTYVTTVALNSNKHVQNDPQPSSSSKQRNDDTTQSANETAVNRIVPQYNVSLTFVDLPTLSNSYVAVYSDVPIYNLTIVYSFTSLNGASYAQKIGYGNYSPTYNPNDLVAPGQIHFQYYQIPLSIILACSSTKPTYDKSGSPIGITWDVYPQLSVSVYGYS